MTLRMPTQNVVGLTANQVQEHRRNGRVNRVAVATSRPISAILRGNLLTLFNAILGGAVVLLLVVGQFRDAVLISTLVIFSILISTIQEIRAKLRLDQIALLAQSQIRVIRDGREQKIDPDEVVLGDFLVLAPGEQVIADGVVAQSDRLEMDESLLTGESDPIRKGNGNQVLSGSFCLAGSGVYEATRVGNDSYIHSLTSEARRYRNIRTPLQHFINQVLEVLLVVVIGLWVLQTGSFLLRDIPLVEAARATAVIATLIPQGLLVMSTATYSLGALRVARRNGLVQQLNAVESLSHVDVLCTDKTGTLTRNRLVLREVIACGGDATEVTNLIGRFAASFPDANSTLRAIDQGLGSAPTEIRDSIPFDSTRKWSAVSYADQAAPGIYVLGAPDILRSHIASPDRLFDEVEERAADGQRVLLFAYTEANVFLRSSDDTPVLPPGLKALALISLEEEMRENAPETLATFRNQGVAIKVISGDHPQTVLALARRAGLDEAEVAVSGFDLAELSPADFTETVMRQSVFGRTTPDQKKQIIRTLRNNGRYVAMIGDGANDLLPLKEAQLGIALQSGSPATRGVADIILLNDAFDVLPLALHEGRRVIGGMYLVTKLFLIRIVATIVLILASGVLLMPFPLLPPHITIVAFLTVGVPALFLVAWAEAERPSRNVQVALRHFILTVGIVSAIAVMASYVLMLGLLDASILQARSAVVTAAVLSGLVVLLTLRHPLSAPISRLLADRRMVALVSATLLFYIFLIDLPATQALLELEALALSNWVVIVSVVTLCFGVLRVVARRLSS